MDPKRRRELNKEHGFTLLDVFRSAEAELRAQISARIAVRDEAAREIADLVRKLEAAEHLIRSDADERRARVCSGLCEECGGPRSPASARFCRECYTARAERKRATARVVIAAITNDSSTPS